MEYATQLCGEKCELFKKPGGHFDIYDIVDEVFGKYQEFITKIVK